MRTRIEIDGLRENGAGVPPHQSIPDADFIPRVGEFITAPGLPYESVVVKVVFQYAINPNQQHLVTVTVRPIDEEP
jgi:hypothetical protein